ncbi:Uma2 family endonuclease [Streptomyces sp. NPDC001339]|uniref:Uma2 family endonuclease n=1 Tax=Streptomyces sp. NPDC001339 TaxID=3364563 RepID=UPI003687261E
MSAQPDPYANPGHYSDVDPEKALKYAVQHIKGDRAQIIEGVIEPVSPSWDHENVGDSIRAQIAPRVRDLGCISGSGNLDLPGSANWYVPDLAVVPRDLAKGGEALLPNQTLLVVEVTSDSNAETDRVAKRKRYAEYGAPLYLLVDRQERSCTLFAEPGQLGYTHVEGPHPFGTPITLPEPFGLVLDTSEL